MARSLADFDMNLLRTFRVVARTGSVSAAARVLCREQPSVSAALKRLEDHFGVALCTRSSRGIVLTEAGHAVLNRCLDVDQALDQLAEDIGKLKGEAILTFQMISDVISPLFDRALVTFHRACPNVEVKIEIAPWRQVLQSVRDSRVILGVACDSRLSEELSYRPLIYESQQLYCGSAHPLFGKAPMNPEMLIDERFVSTGEDEPDQLLQFRRTYGLGRRSCGTAETLHEARKLIGMGFGLGFLPTVVADASDEALWPLLPPDILPRYPLYVVTRRDAKMTTQTQAYLATFLAEIELSEPDYS